MDPGGLGGAAAAGFELLLCSNHLAGHLSESSRWPFEVGIVLISGN